MAGNTPGLPSQYGLDSLNKYGINVSGGSTVNSSPNFNAGAYFGGGMQAGTPGSPVYMGPTMKGSKPPVGPYAPGYRAPYTGASSMGLEEANQLPTSWSEKQKKEFVAKGILYGMPGFDYNMGMPEIYDAWGEMVKRSQELSQGGQDWSPWDVMESYRKDDNSWGTVKKGDWLYDARTGEKVKYVGPKSKTTTSKNINLSSPEDVKALTTQMLTELLGRAPNAEELAKYRASINGYERSNPEVTTTTQNFDTMGEVTSQSSTTSGGASQAALSSIVGDQAKQGPEYGKFQSGTTYFNALMQMIAGG